MKKKTLIAIFASSLLFGCCASRSDEDAKAIHDWSMQSQYWKRADSTHLVMIKAYQDTVNNWRQYVPANH